LQPTEVDVTNDLSVRWGEPEIAVNAKNPNNLVYFVMINRFAFECVASGRKDCGDAFTPGKLDAKVFVSFDRGKTWSARDFPDQVAGKPPLEWKGDPMVASGPDSSTFYIAWDAFHFTPNSTPTFPFDYGCIATSKSIYEGLTWSEPVCMGTPIDRPWLVSDSSTGRIYESSTGNIGPTSAGDPSAPLGAVSDRWLVASDNSVSWSAPKRLGGTDGTNQFSGAGSSSMVAANGLLAATFRSNSAAACTFFVGGAAPCTVFEKTTDEGATWIRHRVAIPADSTGTVMVTADPTTPGRYTVAVLNAGQQWFLEYRTDDFGVTWVGPTIVTDDATKAHFHPWLASSTDGVIGLMWQTNQLGPGATSCEEFEGGPVTTCYPYNVWAAISDNDGATFSSPLKISKAESPASVYLNSDDFSFISLSHQDAYIGWADWRPGDRSGFFSAVKLQAFTFNGR
jgi:hypothetical protein